MANFRVWAGILRVRPFQTDKYRAFLPIMQMCHAGDLNFSSYLNCDLFDFWITMILSFQFFVGHSFVL